MSKLFEDIHIYRSEYECPCCGNIPPKFYENQIYYDFFCIFENTRKEWGRPLIIPRGGGYRCPKYQKLLKIQGRPTAMLSPHYFGIALDIDLNDREEIEAFVDLLERKYPWLRIGFQRYLDRGMSFVHFDIAFKVIPQPVPSWIEGYRW